MKETILYISKSENDIQSFLKYLQRKLEENKKACSLDKEHRILKTKNYDVIGKNIHGTYIGTGYGYCLYCCFSNKFDKSTYAGMENKKLKEILMHTRHGAKEISELEIMYMLELF